jgi:pyrimidine deaminase RibD-like protein
MSTLTEQDRHHLRLLSQRTRVARQAPRRLGLKGEALYAASLVLHNEELGMEIFQPGDSADAVKRLAPLLPQGAAALPELTLYLTLEPKAGFDRLPPVTESIRHLGVRRVVLGTLDPSHRYQGEGRRTLEALGVEVVLADGEEARDCQNLIDDYAKSVTKGVASLTARLEIQNLESGAFQMAVAAANLQGYRADAVIRRSGHAAQAHGAWQVVLDAEGWERPTDKTILYQPADRAVAGARSLPFDEGRPNLGVLLRDLASLGIVSAELSEDPELFRQALTDGLLDSVKAHLPESGDPSHAMARLTRVHLARDGEPVELSLNGGRLVDAQRRYLETRLEIQ